MRTTVRLDDQLLRDVKRYAVESGRTMTAVIEDALRELLARRGRPGAQTRVALPTVGGRGLQPGVDLDDTASLLELMADERDPA
jgi:hypothetical protein